MRYTVDGEWPGAFIAQVILTNTGTQPISGWSLVWSFTGAQRVTEIWNATATQSGARVTAVSESWNRTIQPGQSINMAFLGTSFNANPVARARHRRQSGLQPGAVGLGTALL